MTARVNKVSDKEMEKLAKGQFNWPDEPGEKPEVEYQTIFENLKDGVFIALH